MKKIFALLLSVFVMGSAIAETQTNPAESNEKESSEKDVDVSKNPFTGSKTVTTTKKSSTQTKPGVKTTRMTKNIKKYDKNGVLIKDETDVENSGEQNK